MKLTLAANKFNRQVAVDAYNPSVEVSLQYEPLSYSKIDGTNVTKRMVSCSPDVTMPQRSVIALGGMNYLVGHGAPDYWGNEVIRVNYVIQGADGLANLSSIVAKLSDTAPTTAYAALVFSKYMPDAADNSKYPPQYQVFLAGTESVPADSLIELAGTYYLVKQSYLSTSGLRIALSNIVDEPCFETITFGSRTYDPISDTYSSSGTSAKIFRVKWSESFSYMSKASTTFERGDMQVFMLKTHTPKPSDVLALSDGSWKVLSVQDEGSAWRCHVRRS